MSKNFENIILNDGSKSENNYESEYTDNGTDDSFTDDERDYQQIDNHRRDYQQRDNHRRDYQQRDNYRRDYQQTKTNVSVNPLVHKTIEHTVHIDSSHREHIFNSAIRDTNVDPDKHALPTNIKTHKPEYSDVAFNSRFTYVPSAPFQRVVSMKLCAINLPSTWYTFDYKYGNTTFRLDEWDGSNWVNKGGTASIGIGNYTKHGLLRQIEHKARDLYGGPCLEFFIEGEAADGSEPGTGRLKGHSTTGKKLRIVYYGDNVTNNYPANIAQMPTYPAKKNKNLGRHLGIRRAPDENNEYAFEIPASDNPRGELLGETSIDVFGSRYFYLVINEQTPARASITKAGTGALKEKVQNQRSEIPESMHILAKINLANNGLTRSTGSGLLTNNLTTPTIISDTGIQSNTRNYFGPITIEKLDIQLLDAFGHKVDFHDHDWSFTLKLECEYSPSSHR